MPSGSGGIFNGVYPGRSAGADDDVSGDLGRTDSSRSRMSSHRGVRGAAKYGEAGLCTCRARRDRTSGVRSTRSAETISVRIFACRGAVRAPVVPAFQAGSSRHYRCGQPHYADAVPSLPPTSSTGVAGNLVIPFSSISAPSSRPRASVDS